MRRDSESLFKSRVLIGILLAYNIILTLTNVYLLFLAPLEWRSAWLSAALVFALQMIWLGVLIAMRYFAYYRLYCEIMLASTALSIAIGVYVSGGPIISPATAVNVVPIIMAFVLSGRQAGLIWAQIVLSVHAGMLLLSLLHIITFPQMLDLRYMEVHHGVHWLITYLAIMGLMFVFDTLNTRLKHERDTEKARFEYLAAHDPLTNLANRHMFDDNLKQALSRSDRHKSLAGLLFIDLDNFKPINDRMGHAMGDKALQVISARLKTSLRRSDTVARMGGDEFAIIIEDIDSQDNIVSVAEKVLEQVRRPIKGIPNDMVLTASVGVAVYPLHTQDKNRLINYADQAMYSAKKTKNSFCIYKGKGLARVLS